MFPTGEEAFEAIAEAYNRAGKSLLIDTYDTRQAIHRAIEVALRSQETQGYTLAAVRLDSGDSAHALCYSEISIKLDCTMYAFLPVLDEWKIENLLKAGAAIDLLYWHIIRQRAVQLSNATLKAARWVLSIKKFGMSTDQATNILR